jgi:hypothetical protein
MPTKEMFTLKDIRGEQVEFEDTYKRPTNTGRLSFKDFFKLEEGQELTIHSEGLQGSNPDRPNEENVQFISIRQGEFGFGPKTWGINFRMPDGEKLGIDLHFLGVTKCGHNWKDKIWVSHKITKDNNSYLKWVERQKFYG